MDFMSFLYVLEDIRTPFLNKVMQFFTNFGGEVAFIVAGVFVFWCISKKCGYYMLTVGFSGIVINQFLKLWFQVPRPWVKDPNFTIVESARAEATGYSFPSGHTQNIFATMGAPARYFPRKVKRKALLCIPLVTLMVLTAFSRMYLGVHTPLDVGVSVVIGLILMFGLFPLFRDAEKNAKAIYTLFSVFVLVAAAFICFVEFYDFPSDISPENIVEGTKNAYMIFFSAVAMFISYHIERKHINFKTEAVWWAQLIKLGVGLGIALVIKEVLKKPMLALFGGHAIAHGVRYFVMIMFICTVWPLTFKFFGRLGQKKS